MEKYNRKLEGWNREEHHNLYLTNIIVKFIVLRWVSWARHDKCMGDVRIICKILVV